MKSEKITSINRRIDDLTKALNTVNKAIMSQQRALAAMANCLYPSGWLPIPESGYPPGLEQVLVRSETSGPHLVSADTVCPGATHFMIIPSW